MDHVENGHGFSERYGCLQINVRLLGNSAQILNVVDDILDPPVWKHPLRLRPEHNLASPAPTASAPSVTGILQAWCVDGKESTHVDQTHSFFSLDLGGLTFRLILFMYNACNSRRCACEYLYAFTYKYIYIYTYIYSICICVYSIYQCILYMYIVCQYVHMCWSCPIVVVSIYHATSKK